MSKIIVNGSGKMKLDSASKKIEVDPTVSGCDGPSTPVCNVFPQYLDVEFSGITISNVGYFEPSLSIYYREYDTDASNYNITLSVPFSSSPGTLCFYVISQSYTEINYLDIGSDCYISYNDTSGTTVQIRIDYSARSISVLLQDPSTPDANPISFNGGNTYTVSEWNAVLANKSSGTISNINSITSNTTSLPNCGITALDGRNIGESGSCVVTW